MVGDPQGIVLSWPYPHRLICEARVIVVLEIHQARFIEERRSEDKLWRSWVWYEVGCRHLSYTCICGVVGRYTIPFHIGDESDI